MIILQSGYVYSILNLINGKSYIGICKNFDKRVKEHKRKLNTQKHHNRYLQHSWNKYGETNFKFFIIFDNILRDELSKYEKLLIKLFKTNNSEFGYNLTEGGDGISGYKHSQEYVDSMKKPRPELSGEKHPFFNQKHTEETKKIISLCMSGENNGMYGKKHSVETKRKISEKMKTINRNKTKSISEKTINIIKEMLKQGVTQIKISQILNIAQPTISLIKNNKY